MELEMHISWLNSQLFNLGDSAEICQCTSEKVIKKSESSARMRAELLSYVFLDQLIHAHYSNGHAAFKNEYPGPELLQHTSLKNTSACWFIYSRHGYDTKADWGLIQSTFSDFLHNGLKWLKSNDFIIEDNYWRLVENKINSEFEQAHRPRLLLALEGS